jgi:hypothetical protein
MILPDRVVPPFGEEMDLGGMDLFFMWLLAGSGFIVVIRGKLVRQRAVVDQSLNCFHEIDQVHRTRKKRKVLFSRRGVLKQVVCCRETGEEQDFAARIVCSHFSR